MVRKDSLEDTGNTALESHFFFFLQKHRKKSKIKKGKEKENVLQVVGKTESRSACLTSCVIQCTSATLSREGCSSPASPPCPRRPPLRALLRVHPRVVGCCVVATEPSTATSLTTSALDSNADLPAINSCSSKSHSSQISTKALQNGPYAFLSL